MPPFFTISTSTYNAADTLPPLLDSLASQTCRDFNWIVQDGASSDATMQIVEQYRDRLPEILADSSKDSGIYDAWNKAIDRWQDKMGEWVLFLGADDELNEAQTLEKCKSILENISTEIIFACGDALIINGDKIIRTFPANTNTGLRFLPYNMPFCHTAMFTRCEALLTGFDSSFKIAGDHDFFCRTWKHKNQALSLHIIVAKMAATGISSTQELTIFKEKNKIRKRYFPAIYYKTFLLYFFYRIDMTIRKNKQTIKKFFIKSKIGILIWSKFSELHKKVFSRVTKRS